MLAARLRTVADIAKSCPAITEAQLRWWLHKGADVGFDRVAVRVGRRVYIDADAFDAWLEAGRGRAAEGPR